MQIEYYPDTDMLNITFVPTPYEPRGAEETSDADVVIHYDTKGRIAEIEHASERVDVEEMRRKVSFEEIRESVEPDVKPADVQ